MHRIRWHPVERWLIAGLTLLLLGWTVDRIEHPRPDPREVEEALRACRSAAADRWPALEAPAFGPGASLRRLGPSHYQLTSELRDQHTSLASLSCEAKRAAGGWQAVDLRLTL